MASLSDTLIANGAQQLNKGVDVAGDLMSGVQAGVQLATAKEQVEQKKTQVADMKMELQTKQATAMMNRTKAAMFAQSPAAFDSIMKANENYANSIGLPYNGEALRAAYKDPNLRLAAQKEINTVLQGGVSKNPQAIIDFFGSDSPAIFEHLQNASYANAKVKVGHDNNKEIHGMDNASRERIAAMGIDKASTGANAKVEKETRGALVKANDKFKSEMKKETDALTSMQSASELISQGGVAASAGRRALAKAFNSGAMTDQDVADIAGGKSLLQKANQLAETALTGDLTPDNEKELLNIAETLIPAMQKKISDRAELAADSFSRIYPDVAKDEILNILNPQGLGGAGLGPNAKDQAFIDKVIKGGGTKEQALEFLKQKKAQVKAGG